MDGFVCSNQRETITAVSRDFNIPIPTLQRRYQLYLNDDDRSIHPLFHNRGRALSDSTEQTILNRVKADKKLFNSADVRPVAAAIYNEQKFAETPSANTRSQHPHVEREFNASDRWMQRFKRRHRLHSTKPKNKRFKKRLSDENYRLINENHCIEFVYNVRAAIDFYGGAFVVNADEISAKIKRCGVRMARKLLCWNRSSITENAGRGG